MKKLIFLVSCLSLNLVFGQSDLDRVLAKAIQYHDPAGQWATLNGTFYFTETRPNGDDRSSSFVIDNNRGYAKINRNDEEIYEVLLDSCNVLAGGKESSRGLMLRNYYLYLWGLPMKLQDEGTPFDRTISQAEIDGISCDVIRVTYEKDTWYFYIDKSTGRMVEYKFYQDENETKGEVIKLEEELQIGDMRIPKRRSWYTLPDKRLLGTDILDRFE